MILPGLYQSLHLNRLEGNILPVEVSKQFNRCKGTRLTEYPPWRRFRQRELEDRCPRHRFLCAQGNFETTLTNESARSNLIVLAGGEIAQLPA